MKITYLKLKNFASIYAGMKVNEVEIDFSKSKNRVVLFIGENGTGKTSILSQLHPFAMPGSIDQQNNGPSIIKAGTDGYKEIHYDNDGVHYIIEHFYRYSSSKGLKSFITRDGEELNPNGNVTSFATVIEQELGIESDFMALLRLGTNVTGFMGKTAAGRKAFIGDLLKDIDIYSKFYKKVNDDSRFLNRLLKSVAEKIRKLNVYDETVEITQLEDHQHQLEENQNNKSIVEHELGKVAGKMSTVLDYKTVDETKLELKHIKQTVQSLVNKRDKLVQKIESNQSLPHSGILKDELHQTELKHSSVRAVHDQFLKQLDELLHSYTEKQDSLKFVTREEEYSIITSLYLDLHRKYTALKDQYKDFNIKASRDDVLLAISAMEEIQTVASSIYESDSTAVRRVIELIRDNQSVKSYVDLNLRRITVEHEQLLQQSAMRRFPQWKRKEGELLVLFEQPGCEGKCPYHSFYDEMTKARPASEDNDELRLVQLEVEKDYFLSYLDIEKSLNVIQILLRSNSELESRLPFKLFNEFEILEKINNFDSVYNENRLTQLASIVEGYEEFNKLKHRLNEVERDKLNMEQSKGSLTEVQKALAELDDQMELKNKDLMEQKEQLNKLEETLVSQRQSYETAVAIEEMKEELALVETDLLVEQTSFNSLSHKLESVKDLEESRITLNSSLIRYKKEIHHHSEEITKIQYRLMEFNKLEKERKQLNEKFEEVNIIKDALSPTKGIPLLFIKLYLQNSRTQINDLLNIVYGGDLELDEFVINEKEFRIPYFKQGIHVDDVSSCSQGEKSFVNLALSFTLIGQYFKDYNIMLFDELDGPLDPKKKGMFIPILEKKLDSIDAEQAFVISHSNVFDSYPVDIIMTSEVNIDNYKNTNVIFKP